MDGAVDDERLCLAGEWRRVNGSGINHPAKGWFAASALPDQGANLDHKRDNLVQQAAAAAGLQVTVNSATKDFLKFLLTYSITNATIRLMTEVRPRCIRSDRC